MRNIFPCSICQLQMFLLEDKNGKLHHSLFPRSSSLFVVRTDDERGDDEDDGSEVDEIVSDDDDKLREAICVSGTTTRAESSVSVPVTEGEEVNGDEDDSLTGSIETPSRITCL